MSGYVEMGRVIHNTQIGSDVCPYMHQNKQKRHN